MVLKYYLIVRNLNKTNFVYLEVLAVKKLFKLNSWMKICFARLCNNKGSSLDP